MSPLDLYKYNPGIQTLQEIEATFVARGSIRDEVIEILRTRAADRVNQHVLITGPRGIGKTTLLLAIRARVEADADLRRAYRVVQMAEEEYSIASLRDLFARAVELGDCGSDPEMAQLLARMDGTPDDLDAAEIGVEGLERIRAATGRKFLLLIENLDLILGDQIKSEIELGLLRDILMNRSFLVVVATAPTYFHEVSRPDRPFFHFFRELELDELTREEVIELLRRRAEVEANQVLLGRFDSLGPRIDAIVHLAGGNPRLLLMLYQILSRREVPEVRAALLEMLDEATPYYKGRLEALPAQQRKVLDSFARFEGPTAPSEIAEVVRLPVNQVNSILKRLEGQGLVALAPQKRRRRTLYLLSDRVFRLWHQMRFGSRGRRRLGFLVEFLRAWYARDEWIDEFDRVASEYEAAFAMGRILEARRLTEHMELLVDAAPCRKEGLEASLAMALKCHDEGDLDGAERLLEDCETLSDPQHVAQALYLRAQIHDHHGRLDEATADLERAIEIIPEWLGAHALLGHVLEMKYFRGDDPALLERSQSHLERAWTKDAPPWLQFLFGYSSFILALRQDETHRRRVLLEKALQAAELFPEEYRSAGLLLQGESLSRLAKQADEASQRKELLARAVEPFRRRVGLEPTFPARLDLADALHDLFEVEPTKDRAEIGRAAIREARLALDVAPEDDRPRARLALARCLLSLAAIQSEEDSDASREEANRLLEPVENLPLADPETLSTLMSAAEDPAQALERICPHVLAHAASQTPSPGLAMSLLFIGALVPSDEHASECFERGLDLLERLGPSSWPVDMCCVLLLVQPGRAARTAEFLRRLETRGMSTTIERLDPLVQALRARESHVPEDVLDRLAPEVRAVVQGILAVWRSEPVGY